MSNNSAYLDNKYCAGRLVSAEVKAQIRKDEIARRKSVSRAKDRGTHEPAIFRFDKFQSVKVNRVKRYITSIVFDLSRYGEHSYTIVFVTPVTKYVALRNAEEYLSAPLTKEYHERVCDDLFIGIDGWPYEALIAWGYENRGQLLGENKRIEGINVDKNGQMSLQLGS